MNIEEQRHIKTLITSGDYNEAIENLKKVDVNTELDGRSALGYAASYNNFEVAKYVLENGANPNGLESERFTPLMIAAERGNLELIKLLLEKGADINIKTPQNVVALWKAAGEDNIEASKLLVEAGANPFVEITSGLSIYDVCKQMGKENVTSYFETLK